MDKQHNKKIHTPCNIIQLETNTTHKHTKQTQQHKQALQQHAVHYKQNTRTQFKPDANTPKRKHKHKTNHTSSHAVSQTKHTSTYLNTHTQTHINTQDTQTKQTIQQRTNNSQTKDTNALGNAHQNTNIFKANHQKQIRIHTIEPNRASSHDTLQTTHAR